MKSKLIIRSFPPATWAAVIALSLAMTQTNVRGGDTSPLSGVDGEGGPPSLEVEMDASFTSAGEAKFRGAQFGDSDAYNFNFSAMTFVPLSEHWSMPFQLESQNVSLGSLPGLPIPDSIHMMEIGSGLAYRPNERWMWMACINAQLYKFDDIGSDDIGISGGLMGEWQYSQAMKWVFGVMYQPNNSMPLIPMVGGEWQINDEWQLLLTFPQPRLVFSPDDKWSFHVGMDLILGTTFRTTDTFGNSTGLSKFNNQLGSYSDTRIGAGIGYQLNKSLRLEVEGGMSMGRSVEYEDIDEKVKFDSAPYFRLGLRYEF